MKATTIDYHIEAAIFHMFCAWDIQAISVMCVSMVLQVNERLCREYNYDMTDIRDVMKDVRHAVACFPEEMHIEANEYGVEYVTPNKTNRNRPKLCVAGEKKSVYFPC